MPIVEDVVLWLRECGELEAATALAECSFKCDEIPVDWETRSEFEYHGCECPEQYVLKIAARATLLQGDLQRLQKPIERAVRKCAEATDTSIGSIQWVPKLGCNSPMGSPTPLSERAVEKEEPSGHVSETHEAKAMKEYGCLTAFDSFNTILFKKQPYDLTDADQAREMLRFMCDREAFDPDSALSKGEILEHLRSTCEITASDWRPAHVFRKWLAPLYADAIGRQKGHYWLRAH